MGVSVRPLVGDDRERWSGLWQDYVAFYETTLPQETTDNTWGNLMEPNAGHQGLVALDEQSRIIGFTHYLIHPSTWTATCYCYLEDLFVEPQARGLGAGRALINAVENAARAEGATRFYLVTQEFNGTARGLYDKTMTLAPFVQYRKLLD